MLEREKDRERETEWMYNKVKFMDYLCVACTLGSLCLYKVAGEREGFWTHQHRCSVSVAFPRALI